MGPASIAADFFRPQATDTLAAQSRKTAAEDIRFDDYLDEAQSAEKAREPKDVEQKDDASDSDVPADADSDSSDAAEASAQAAAQAAVAQPIITDTSNESADDEIALASIARVEAGVADHDSESGTASQVKAADLSASSVRVAAENADRSVQATRSDVNPDVGAASSRDLVDSTLETESKAGKALQEAASRPIESTAEFDADDIEPVRVVKSQDAQRARTERPADDANLDKKPGSTQAAIEKAVRDHEPIVARETLQQRKVREASEARRVDPANTSANQPEKKSENKRESGLSGDASDTASRGLSKRGDASPNASRPGAFAARLESVGGSSPARTEAATIKTGVGDPAAVSAIRFLISGQSASSQTTTTGVTGNAPSPAGASASVIEASSASGNTIVSDLLTGGADKSGGVDGMARVLNASGGSGRYQATLRLDPPSMGTVRVQLNLQNEGLTIQVDAQSKSVAKLIESRLEDLREALSAHGIRVDRANVVTKAPETSNLADRHDNSPNQFDQPTSEDADYQMPRDAQRGDDSSHSGSAWARDDSTDASVNETRQDTVQGSADQNAGANWIAPGAVDLVA